jgi:hypothetical protein
MRVEAVVYWNGNCMLTAYIYEFNILPDFENWGKFRKQLLGSSKSRKTMCKRLRKSGG